MAKYTDITLGITSNWLLGDSNWDVENNVNLSVIRALLIPEVEAVSNNVASPVAGDFYIVGAVGTEDFLGHDNELAYYRGATEGWVFVAAAPRIVKYNKTTSQLIRWDGSNWISFVQLANLVEDVTPELGGSLDCLNKTIIKANTVTFNGEVANTGVGAQTVDFATGQKQKFTITGATTITLDPPAGVGNFQLKLINAGSSITWGTTILWVGGVEPTWSGAGTDILTLYYDGTTYYGMAGIAFS